MISIIFTSICVLADVYWLDPLDPLDPISASVRTFDMANDEASSLSMVLMPFQKR